MADMNRDTQRRDRTRAAEDEFMNSYNDPFRGDAEPPRRRKAENAGEQPVRRRPEGSAARPVRRTEEAQPERPVRRARPEADDGFEQPVPTRSAKKSKKKWRRFILIYTLVFLLVGAAGLTVLYKFLDSYEKSLPQHAIDDYMNGVTEEQWKELFLSGGDPAVTEFESKDDILTAYFEKSCAGKPVTAREAAGVSDVKAPVFTVSAGSAAIARIYLQADEHLPFNRCTWKVQRCEPFLNVSRLSSVNLTVEAPAGEQVCINGVPVGEGYVTDANVPCENLTALEQRYSEPPHRVRYAVSGLYGDITVTDGTGVEVFPTDPEAVSPAYVLGGTAGYGFTAVAPAEATVYVNGTALTKDEQSDYEEGLLTGLERYIGDKDSGTATYHVEGLYAKPEITAESSLGAVLTDSSEEEGIVSFTYAGDEAVRAELQGVVEKFFDNYINYSAGNTTYYYQPLLNCLLPGTDLYTYVSQSADAMYWASDTKLEFEYCNYTDFVKLSDSCFTCSISYKANSTSQQWYQTVEDVLENSYDLVFVKEGENWLCAVMTAA